MPAAAIKKPAAKRSKKAAVLHYDPDYASKFNIWPPEKIAWVERSDFLKSLDGEVQGEEIGLEEILMKDAQFQAEVYRCRVGNEPHFRLNRLAQWYSELTRAGARVPKFSRWVASLFPKEAEFQAMLSRLGKQVAPTLVFSTNMIDILRCANGPHLSSSCFKYNKGAEPDDKAQGYGNMPKQICEQTPGISIVYNNDENGFMKGRAWIHHAKNEAGEDIVVAGAFKGNMTQQMVLRAIAARGFKAYSATVQYGANPETVVPIVYQGCFKTSVHHDVLTHPAQQKAVKHE